MINSKIELFMLDRNTVNHLTMRKQMSSGLLKNVFYEVFVYKSYILNIYVWTGFGIK